MNSPLAVPLICLDETLRQRLAGTPVLQLMAEDAPAPVPGILILGVGTLHPEDIARVAHLNARYAPCKVLVVSWDDSPEPLILEVFRNGAWGYLALSKTQTDEQILAAQILAAIRTLLGGGAVISPRLTAQVLDEISQ